MREKVIHVHVLVNAPDMLVFYGNYWARETSGSLCSTLRTDL